MFDPKIQNTIDYHTRQIAKICKLDAQSTDDVRQELTLTALVAMENHTADMSANLLTYVKAALNRGAAGVVRKIKNAPPTANADTMLDLDEIQDSHRRKADPNKPYEPLTISTGNFLERLSECTRERDINLKLDIEAILQKLSPREQVICRMLMAGHTQREIANALGLQKSRVSEIIQQLTVHFSEITENM